MDDHGLRHGRDRGESSSSSSIEIQNQWREIQDLLKERLITQDDFLWKLPIPSSSGNVAVEEEEEGTLLKYVGGVDVSYSKELDSAAAASTAACGCGSLVVLDVTTPTLQVVYQDFFLLTNFDVPYIPSFLAFREAPILLQLLQKMKNTDNPFYPQLLLVDGNGLLHPRGDEINQGLMQTHIYFSWSPCLSQYCHQNCENDLQVSCARAYPAG